MAAGFRLTWHGDRELRRFTKMAENGVRDSADFVVGHAKQLIGTPGPPRSKAGPIGGTTGEPPRVDTGELLASVASTGPIHNTRAQTIVAAAGTPLAFGRYLEYGWVHNVFGNAIVLQGPRPWIRPSFDFLGAVWLQFFKRI